MGDYVPSRNIYEHTIKVFEACGKTKREAFEKIKEIEKKNGLMSSDGNLKTEYWTTNIERGIRPGEVVCDEFIIEKLRNVAKERSVSNAKLASHIGVSKSNMERWLLYPVKYMRRNNYNKIINFLKSIGEISEKDLQKSS